MVATRKDFEATAAIIRSVRLATGIWARSNPPHSTRVFIVIIANMEHAFADWFAQEKDFDADRFYAACRGDPCYHELSPPYDGVEEPQRVEFESGRTVW